jgi:hypothetical protein
MPRRSEPVNLYQLERKKGMRFREAAATAIDLALRSRESVTITEFSPGGELLGHIYVEATNDNTAG